MVPYTELATTSEAGGHAAVPILAVLAGGWLMLNLTALTWLRFLVWMALGLVVYLGYGRGHSRLPKRPRSRISSLVFPHSSLRRILLVCAFVPVCAREYCDMGNTTVIILIVVAIVAVAIIATVGTRLATRKRSERLQEQFGPEYERAVRKSGDQRGAESELRERAKRHDELELRELKPAERSEFERRWTQVQGQFVDDPSDAVRSADRLVVEVMSARGYPVDDFDQRADDLSVRHPEVTQRYREARRIAQANQEGSADTEDLRQAVTSYRSLVEALLAGDGDAGPDEHTNRQARGERKSASADESDRETRS